MKKQKAICWVTILALMIALSGCAGKQELSLPPSWNGDFSIELPEGYSVSQDEEGNQIYSDGSQTIGGMTIRTVPEGFEITEYFRKDFMIALGIAEASDDSLGYSGGGSPAGMGNGGWIAEYFSDVPDPEDRTIYMVHQFFVMNDEVTILDFWIDRMLVDNATKGEILDSIEIPEIGRYRQDPPPMHTIPQDAAYELLDLPEGYYTDILGEGCILFIDGEHAVAGMDIVKIPDGAYDPNDPYWVWLEKAGMSDYRNEHFRYLGGMTADDNSWVAEFANEVPEGQPGRIHRRHIYRVIGNDLYDIWLDMVLLTYDEAEMLSKAVRFAEE